MPKYRTWITLEKEGKLSSIMADVNTGEIRKNFFASSIQTEILGCLVTCEGLLLGTFQS